MSTMSFIGVGNMGSALARAAAKKLRGSELLLSNRSPEKAQRLSEELDCAWGSVEEAAAQGKFIFLGVKPQMLPALMSQIAPILSQRKDCYVLVTMAAGISIEGLLAMEGLSCPVVRIMPNTPAAIGQGTILYCGSKELSSQLLDEFLSLMEGAGRFVALEERLIDAGSAVSGCGPAFVDLFIEALADGAVACGLPRATAMELAAQMCLGSAALVLSGSSHPGALKDAVCSPGGTTIQGVRKLEEKGFRSAVIEAVIAAYEKNFDLK